MDFASMKGKLLHLYEHSHQAKLQTLKHVVQTPPDGPFDHDDLLCSKLSFDTLGCNKALTLLRSHSSPQFGCFIS
jgi:hypothetical protein